MTSYWLASRSYEVQEDCSREVYLVGLVDDVAGLGGLAVSLMVWELGLWKGNWLKQSRERRLKEFLILLYIPCTLYQSKKIKFTTHLSDY